MLLESYRTVFAARVAEGAKGIDECPPLEGIRRAELHQYMSRFNLIDG